MCANLEPLRDGDFRYGSEHARQDGDLYVRQEVRRKGKQVSFQYLIFGIISQNLSKYCTQHYLKLF